MCPSAPTDLAAYPCTQEKWAYKEMRSVMDILVRIPDIDLVFICWSDEFGTLINSLMF